MKLLNEKSPNREIFKARKYFREELRNGQGAGFEKGGAYGYVSLMNTSATEATDATWAYSI